MSENTGIDRRRLGALAKSFRASPREILALAARLSMAKAEAPLDRTRIEAELARVRAAGATASAATELLLLGYARYASDDLDRALEMVWSVRHGDS